MCVCVCVWGGGGGGEGGVRCCTVLHSMPYNVPFLLTELLPIYSHSHIKK